MGGDVVGELGRAAFEAVVEDVVFGLDEAAREKYKFHFAYRTAGFWHVTEVWSREEPRRSPEEMAKVMLEITSFPSEVHIL